MRSQMMSRVRSVDTKPEMRLRRRLWAEGLRYRVNMKTPVGRPDLVFKGPRVAVFVDGCFWHGCPDHYVRPRSSSDFWSRKLAENVARDRRQTLALEEAGWTVWRFWEHEVFLELDRVVDLIRGAVLFETGSVDRRTRWHVVEVIPLNEKGDEEWRVLEALRDPDRRLAVERPRSTAKW